MNKNSVNNRKRDMKITIAMLLAFFLINFNLINVFANNLFLESALFLSNKVVIINGITNDSDILKEDFRVTFTDDSINLFLDNYIVSSIYTNSNLYLTIDIFSNI